MLTQHRPQRRADREAVRRVAIGVALVGVLIALLVVSRGRALSPPSRRTTSPSSKPTAPWSDRCVAVADGDTMSVRYQGGTVRVRLNAVDCPEKKQAFGNVAKRFTSDWAFGKIVTVIPMKIDQYGRTVGDVRTPEGRSLNDDLVAAGLAWWYRYYDPDDVHLEALEKEARMAKRGLWEDANPLPPWEFRQRERAAGRGR